MSQVDERFQQLRLAGKKAFIPFVTAGDPNVEFTKSLLLELDRRGASIIEIGFPYSDPIADGPVIQASYQRALDDELTVAEIFAAVGEVSAELEAPIVAMVSYAIIHRHGCEQFIADAKAAGFSGAIVPDLLADESQSLRDACDQSDFSLIQLVTPTTNRERAVEIARSSTGFLYYVSVAGITGERSELPTELVDNVSWIRSQTNVPVCIGFGISQPEHVAKLAPVADGLIVGSAIVKRVAAGAGNEETLEEIGSYVDSLLAAM